MDSEEKIQQFLPAIEEMISGGLVTMEKVKVSQPLKRREKQGVIVVFKHGALEP